MDIKNTAAKWRENFRALRNDERGAESSEVILVLVLLVIGLLGAWAFLKEKIFNKATMTGNCIENANDVAATDTPGGDPSCG
jgi:Flp pilus assembly pilin Flp